MSLRRNVGRIAGYVTEVATQKTGKKTSNTGGLFIASCLRTPLSVLKANFEALEDGINQQEESYPVIHRKLDQINRLIQDIYLISKYDIQQIILYVEPVFLPELMDELVSSIRQLAEKKGLMLSVNDSLTSNESNDLAIEGDRQRLMQLFGNLLQNSLDYTDRGGQLNLSIRAVRSGIEITVEPLAARVLASVFVKPLLKCIMAPSILLPHHWED